jgi:hypothetical protein
MKAGNLAEANLSLLRLCIAIFILRQGGLGKGEDKKRNGQPGGWDASHRALHRHHGRSGYIDE